MFTSKKVYGPWPKEMININAPLIMVSSDPNLSLQNKHMLGGTELQQTEPQKTQWWGRPPKEKKNVQHNKPATGENLQSMHAVHLPTPCR